MFILHPWSHHRRLLLHLLRTQECRVNSEADVCCCGLVFDLKKMWKSFDCVQSHFHKVGTLGRIKMECSHIKNNLKNIKCLLWLLLCLITCDFWKCSWAHAVICMTDSFLFLKHCHLRVQRCYIDFQHCPLHTEIFPNSLICWWYYVL